MVRPLFDTNILIDYLKGFELARAEIARYRDPAISIVSWMEVLVGVPAEREPGARRFLSLFELIEIDGAVAERAVLIRRGNRIRLPDALIRASAEVHALLLVTRNTRDFDGSSPSVRIPYTL
jgi:predicted nucleic acid-binding protein